jgi:hypothetical protein
MTDERYQTCTYRVLRYAPNLLRDEWLNIGVLLHDPERGAVDCQVISEEGELARVRRLHPEADLRLLRALAGDFEAQFRANGSDPAAVLAKLDDTLSNALQLSPPKAVRTVNVTAELARLYDDQVKPPVPRARAAGQADARSTIRTRVTQVFRAAHVLDRIERGVRVEEFTERGDPFRLDFGFARNGTRGFLHAISLARDPAQAKVLAFTAGCIRARLGDAEIYALTETEPRPELDRHRFVARLLAAQGVDVVPLPRVEELATRLRSLLN